MPSWEKPLVSYIHSISTNKSGYDTDTFVAYILAVIGDTDSIDQVRKTFEENLPDIMGRQCQSFVDQLIDAMELGKVGPEKFTDHARIKRMEEHQRRLSEYQQGKNIRSARQVRENQTSDFNQSQSVRPRFNQSNHSQEPNDLSHLLDKRNSQQRNMRNQGDPQGKNFRTNRKPRVQIPEDKDLVSIVLRGVPDDVNNKSSLLQIANQFGQILEIRCLTDKYIAIIMFRDQESALKLLQNPSVFKIPQLRLSWAKYNPVPLQSKLRQLATSFAVSPNDSSKPPKATFTKYEPIAYSEANYPVARAPVRKVHEKIDNDPEITALRNATMEKFALAEEYNERMLANKKKSKIMTRQVGQLMNQSKTLMDMMAKNDNNTTLTEDQKATIKEQIGSQLTSIVGTIQQANKEMAKATEESENASKLYIQATQEATETKQKMIDMVQAKTAIFAKQVEHDDDDTEESSTTTTTTTTPDSADVSEEPVLDSDE